MKEILDILLPTLAMLFVSWMGLAVVIRANERREDLPENDSAGRAQMQSGLPEGRPFVFRNYWSIAVDNNRTTIAVSVSVVVTVLPEDPI